jgi:hypothetical protein
VSSAWPEDDDDDHYPYVDPKIRPSYEAAVGRLIVAYNEVDHRLTELIKTAIEHVPSGAQLAWMWVEPSLPKRINNLRCLSLLLPHAHISQVDDADLLRLHKRRNLVAHGHFAQNPFDGSFSVIEPQNKGKRPTLLAISEVEAAAQELMAHAITLQALEVWGQFRNLDEWPPSPPVE